MNFDEMDIEPKSEPPAARQSTPPPARQSTPPPARQSSPPAASDVPSKEDVAKDEELTRQLLQRTVPLDDGAIGYVFTCSRNGAVSTWRCHACNFVDTWTNLKKHLDTKWHEESMSKYKHSRSNFSKVENILTDFSKGQPLPPGMEEEIAGPCQILKSLETYEHPLIGLEFLLELHQLEMKEPRYLCLLCDKKGDPRSILVHLTSQNHYLMYLRKYFRKFYALIDKLPKSNECRGNVCSVTSHLIAKLEEKYGRLQPTATRDDVVNDSIQRSIILQKIDSNVHFSECAEDAYLEEMLTIEYVQNPQLLLKNFPMKPKQIDTEKLKEDTKSLFNKSTKTLPKKNIRNNREIVRNSREESPDVVFVATSRLPRNGRSRERSPLRPRERSPRRGRDLSPLGRDRPVRRSRERSPLRGRERSPLRGRERSPRRLDDRSPLRGRERSPLRGRQRSPLRPRERSPLPHRIAERSRERSPPRIAERSRERSPHRIAERSPHRVAERSPLRGVDRSPLRGRERSPFRGRDRSPQLGLPPRPRSRSRLRSPSPGRRRYVSPPSHYRSSYRRSRSPWRRSPSPLIDRDRLYRRSPSPIPGHLRSRERSPFPPRYGGLRYRSPEREIRRVVVRRSPSPLSRGGDYPARPRGRSRSRERSPFMRARRTRSRSRPRNGHDVRPGSKSLLDRLSKGKGRERLEPNPNRAYIKEAKEIEDKLNKDMDGYTETPESHPAYQEEWKKFWCAKFKEIQSEGKEDPHKYDYKPEWIVFWNTRVKELFDEDLKSQIKALKSKYGISADEDKLDVAEKLSSSSPGEDDKKPVIDIKTMWKELTGCDIKDEPTSAKRRSLSPWEDDDLASDKGGARKIAKKVANNLPDDGSTQPISPESLSSISDTESPRHNPFRRTRSRSRSRSRSAPRGPSKEYPFRDEYRKPSRKIHFENPLNIITVLRQLSVLEFQLGSYTSHVISLLTSGLTMERIKPQSSIDLLTKENILFLELVKEKLKGQLLAGVVPKSMVKATLFCIKNIEELLQLVPKLKPTAPPPIPAPPPGLLYGAGVDPNAPVPPPVGGPLGYGAHVYGYRFGGFNKLLPYKHFDRGLKERFPFRRPSPKRVEIPERANANQSRRMSDEFPFRNNEPSAVAQPSEKPAAAAAVEEIPIDKNAIALQIAEVLTQQGRSDVSNEELQALINTVVESLKQEQKMKAQQKDSTQLKDVTIPAVMNALSAAAAAASNATLNNAAAAAPLSAPTIPAGFNLNDVSSSTLALLQDAYVNASVLSANKPFAIEDLSEAELIQMLRNFKSIPRVKQEKLIEYLRKLEVTNPERVEELKKYVNVL